MSNPVAEKRKLEALRHAMGPAIAAALAERLVIEVMVNPDGRIWVDKLGSGREFTGHHLDALDAERVLRLVADHAGETVTRDFPRVSATLPFAGERFQGQFMPLVEAPSFAIRKRPEVVFSLESYVASGALSGAQAQILRRSVKNRDNFLIVGGTGSGKTTLANAILAEKGFAMDRVVIIEDTAELQCSAVDQVRLLTRRTAPTVGIAELVRDTLRLRPDRIVVGEVRDGSALEILKAWNTGHPGGLATLHANGAEEGLTRLEELIAEVSARIPHGAIGRAIDTIVHIRRTASGRYVEPIATVNGWAKGAYEISYQ